jgi:hypothetical protein
MAETGMIPPVARRKLMMRERKKQLENRRNITLLLLLAFAASFAFYNMQYIRGLKAANNAIKSVEDVEKISFEAPKTDTKLRRRRSWVTQDSQPFVCPTVTFAIHHIPSCYIFSSFHLVVGNHHRIKTCKPKKRNT